MALPGGRSITVDGKGYHWICKSDRRASRYEETDWGEEVAVYDKTVTIQASTGVTVQHQTNALSITPKEVIEMIRGDVHGRFKRKVR